MQIFKNGISDERIDSLNEFIDEKYPYKDSRWIFPHLNPELNSFFRKLCPEFAEKYITEDSYIVLRLVKAGCLERSYEFHFDQYEETILIPLMLNDSEMNGDLLIDRNKRRTPKNIWTQVFQKAFFQSRPVRAYFKNRAKKGKQFKRVKFNMGTSVLFNGVTDLHGNLPLLNGERRTILVHSKKLFKNSIITAYIESMSQFLVLRNKKSIENKANI